MLALIARVARRLITVGVAVLTTALAAAAWSQGTYPNKPVRLIAPFPAGGSSDIIGRILGQKLAESWGQQLLVENRPGAAGSIGTEYAARQPADGYSFLVGNIAPVATNPLLSKVPHDIQRDFVPVSIICIGPNILVVGAGSPAKTVQELTALARREPGKLNFATGGPSSLAHLLGEMFKRLAGVDIVHVAYKGGGQALPDLVAGQVQLIFSDAQPVTQ
jgi:tripartite-type tricarboxylate transporter receptor subunit TctC